MHVSVQISMCILELHLPPSCPPFPPPLLGTAALIIATSKAFPIPTEHMRSTISGRPAPGRLLSRERKAQEASQITSWQEIEGGGEKLREGKR